MFKSWHLQKYDWAAPSYIDKDVGGQICGSKQSLIIIYLTITNYLVIFSVRKEKNLHYHENHEHGTLWYITDMVTTKCDIYKSTIHAAFDCTTVLGITTGYEKHLLELRNRERTEIKV